MDIQVKKREWVKDAAIIFLAVLLVLTFFSNTIMNRTLPEVATAAVHEGAIVAKVRGTGTVTATGKHQVKAKETRTIRSVMVKVGQEVNTGDVLFVLGEGDETELEQAKERLRTLQTSYQKTALSAPIYDYSSYHRAIESAMNTYNRAVEELNEAQQRLDESINDPVTQAAKARYEAAKAYAEELEREYQEEKDRKIAELKQRIAELSAQIAQLEASAEAAVASQRAALELAQQQYEVKLAEYDAAESVYLAAKDEYDFVLRNVGDIPQSVFDEKFNAYEAAKVACDLAKNALDMAEADVTAAESNLETAYESALGPSYPILQSELISAETELASWSEAAHYEAVRAAIEERDRLYSEYVVLAGTAAEDVKLAEYAVQDAMVALQAANDSLTAAQETNNRSAQTIGVELQSIAEEIALQQEKIKSLAGDESNTVLADVPGTVSTVDCTAGDTVLKNALLCTLEVPDMGYTLSFSVTNDQAQRLRIGDTATVSNYYWGNSVTATLTSVRTDPKNQQGGKILVFDLTGDVTAGSELTISVGQKSANYDLIVPNSAVKSDSNGTFVLAVSVKNSPLGNRYTARRVTVEVVASDDSNSAVVADLSNGDFVITTSSAPVKSGDMVRLTENG